MPSRWVAALLSFDRHDVAGTVARRAVGGAKTCDGDQQTAVHRHMGRSGRCHDRESGCDGEIANNWVMVRQRRRHQSYSRCPDLVRCAPLEQVVDPSAVDGSSAARTATHFLPHILVVTLHCANPVSARRRIEVAADDLPPAKFRQPRHQIDQLRRAIRSVLVA